jgi:hypothetical protein
VLAALVVLAAVVMAPLAVLVLGTFTTRTGVWWPLSVSWEQYRYALDTVDLLRYAKNSLLLGVVYTVPVVFSSLGAGYAFARLRARGSQLLFTVVVATMLVPIFVYLIPLFIVYSRLGLTNTIVPWLLWGLAGNPFLHLPVPAVLRRLPHRARRSRPARRAVPDRDHPADRHPELARHHRTVTILAFTNVWGRCCCRACCSTGTPPPRCRSGCPPASWTPPAMPSSSVPRWPRSCSTSCHPCSCSSSSSATSCAVSRRPD